jgi:ribosomal protein S18 acetylase RimI-like enzyme
VSVEISLRPARQEDEAFLFALFCTSPEYAYLPAEMRDQLLRMQYSAQRSAYGQEFPGSGYEVVLQDEERVGRFWVAGRDEDFYLVDVALLPEYRGKGIGSALINELQKHARNAGKAVRCSVSRFNSGSLRFHQRHGFVVDSEDEMNFSLVWKSV